jgi:hypothetical protein
MTQRCRVCGCSNFSACAGGCWWVEDDLCSSCAPAVDVATGRSMSIDDFPILQPIVFRDLDDMVAYLRRMAR